MYNPISFGHWRPRLVRQPPGVLDVALTFDDGPAPETTPHILRMLDEAGAKATFFLSGVRVAAHMTLAADIVSAGHAVYGHAWEHENLERATADRAVAAMQRVEKALCRLRPTSSPYLLRLPYNAGHNCGWMHRAASRFHPDVRFASWSISTYDYRLAANCADLSELEMRCRDTARKLCGHPSLRGSIVLMHENPFDMRWELAPYTAGALLRPLLDGLAERGVPLGLIQTSAPHRALDRFLLLNATGTV